MIAVDHPFAQPFTKLACIVIAVLTVVYPRNLGYNFSGKRISTGIECRSEAINEPVYRHYHCIHASDWHMNGTA